MDTPGSGGFTKGDETRHDKSLITHHSSLPFYVTGGTLHRDAPSYVQRQADDELYAGLTEGKFCYVLTPRQMGKSSLMVRTAVRLREGGAAVAVLDLTAIGQNLTAEQWYDGLLSRIGQQLDLEDELEGFWLAHDRLGPLQRWMQAMREVVLPRYRDQVVIFVDEIDAVRSLPFSTDEFFAGIREFYNRRSEDAELKRLTFCLLGVATPSDLIRDTRTTPFNIGQRIELTDFTATEAVPLAEGLGRKEKHVTALLQRILYWTGGHPYLTQRLCQAVADDTGVNGAGGVDRVCESLFLSSRARERDDNLLFVRERILRSEADLASLLDLYAQVRSRKPVRDDETNPLVSTLRLSGITRVAEGYLLVRNRIYYRVFDREWVTANMPDAELRRQRAAYRKGLLRAAAVAALILLVMGSLAFSAINQKRIADQQRNRAVDEARRADRNAQELQKALTDLQAALAEAEGQRKNADDQRQQAEASEMVAKHQQAEAEKQRQQAVEQKRIAEQQQAEAEKQRQRAIEQQHIAEQQELNNRRSLYAAHMNLAQNAWETANVGVVLDLLERHRPKPNQEDLRGFEWYHLWRLSHSDRFTLLHTGRVNSVSFSPDGKNLAVVDTTGAVKLWDVTAGQELRTFKGHRIDYSFTSAFSSDGKLLAVNSERGTQGIIKIWDVITGQELATFEKLPSRVSSMALSHDGKLLAAIWKERLAPNDLKSIVKLWDVATGQEVTTLKVDTYIVYSVTFSPDGKQLAIGGWFGSKANAENIVKLWDVATGQELIALKGHTVEFVSFSPDGKLLATAGSTHFADSSEGIVTLWDVAAGKQLNSLKGHMSRVTSIMFSPDSARLASGSFDQTVKLWDVATGQELVTLKGHTEAITSLAFPRDGKLLASGSSDETVKLWDLTRLENESAVLRSEDKPAPDFSSVAFSPDGKKLAVAMGNGTSAHLWDVITGKKVATLKTRAARRTVTALRRWSNKFVAFSPDGKRLAIGVSDGSVKLWDVDTQQELVSLVTGALEGFNPPVAFSPDGKQLATGGESGVVKLWDVATGRELKTLKGQRTRGVSVAFFPDGKRLVLGGWNVLTLWDLVTGKELISFKGCVGICSAALSPDGKLLALMNTADKTVKLLDAATGQELAAFKGHKDEVNSIVFSPDGKRLATGSNDKTVKIWDVITREELFTFKLRERVSSVAFSPDGRTLAAMGDTGTQLLRIETDKADRPHINNAQWHITLARALSRQQKWAEAEAEYREALRWQPNNAQFHSDLGDFLWKREKFAEAEAEYRAAVRSEPNNARWHVVLGEALFNQKKFAEAEVEYREAVQLELDDAWKRADLGGVLSHQQKWAEAEAEFRQAVRLEPNEAYLYINLGECLYQRGKWVESEAQYREALRLEPHNPDALNDLGYLLVERNEKLHEALQMIQQALNLSPINANYRASLGWAYFKLGQLDQAERYLTQAARDATTDDRIQARIQEHLGDLYNRRGKINLARAAWQKALALSGEAEQKTRLTKKLKGEIEK